MAATKKRWFLRFLYFTESSPQSFKVRGLQMTMNLSFSVSTYQQGRRQGKSLEGGSTPGGGPGGGAPWWGSGAEPPEADTFLVLKS